jgi:hypothetical protein
MFAYYKDGREGELPFPGGGGPGMGDPYCTCARVFGCVD